VDHPALAAAAAEKLAVPAPGARARDATFPPPEPQLVRWAQLAEAAELYTPVAAPSAAQSCAAKESAAQPARTRADAARLPVLALTQEMEHEMKLEMEPAVKQQTPKPEVRLAQPAPQAAQAEPQPLEAQPLAAQPEPESQAEVEQPAPLAVPELCSQLAPAEQAPWPPEARQPQAC